MIEELDTVVLTRDIPEQQLRQGDLGTVVLVHRDGAAAVTGERLALAGSICLYGA
jgi:hypothetical protein